MDLGLGEYPLVGFSPNLYLYRNCCDKQFHMTIITGEVSVSKTLINAILCLKYMN